MLSPLEINMLVDFEKENAGVSVGRDNSRVVETKSEAAGVKLDSKHIDRDPAKRKE